MLDGVCVEENARGKEIEIVEHDSVELTEVGRQCAEQDEGACAGLIHASLPHCSTVAATNFRVDGQSDSGTSSIGGVHSDLCLCPGCMWQKIGQMLVLQLDW